MAFNKRTGVFELGKKNGPKERRRPPVLVDLPKPPPPPPPIEDLAPIELSPFYLKQVSELVQKLATELGSKIDLLISQKGTSFYPGEQPIPKQKISIDESILDVGIGETKELKKGAGSSTLSKEEIQSDTQLKSSFSKLRALKKGL